MRSYKFVLLALFFIQSQPVLFAQNNCDNALYEANQNFEKGNIQACIDRLESCLDGMNATAKSESYRLLAISYLELKNEIQTRKYIVALLKSNPQYTLFPNVDPLPLSKLIQQYSTTPKFIIGIHLGGNRTFTNLKKSYSAYISEQRYNPAYGFQIGIDGDYYLNKLFSLSGQISYSGLGINHEIDSAGGWKQNYSEQQKYAAFQLTGHYEKVFKNKMKFRLGTGFGMGYLTKSVVFMESENLETRSLQQDAQNPIDMRFRWQPFYILKGALSFPAAKGFFGIETSYNHYFRNTVNPERRMDDMDFNFTNQYVNDDISLRNFSLLLTFKLPIAWRINLK